MRFWRNLSTAKVLSAASAGQARSQAQWKHKKGMAKSYRLVW
jgi:hypothetical protein